MGGFGSTQWGGNLASSSTVGVSLQTILDAALRIAGLLSRPGWTHSDDQYTELIAAVNRMLASWNCDGHRIFTTSIEQFPLTASQKEYTIGPGGDFDADRPIYIKTADILFPTSPVVRRPVKIISDDEWSRVAVQDIPGAPPYQLYYDGGLDANGRGNIFLRFQPPAGYILELYTWQALQATFVSKTDVALFPPGYELAIVEHLAIIAAALNPRESALAPGTQDRADRALHVLISLNSQSPEISCEAGLDRDIGPGYGWLDGGLG